MMSKHVEIIDNLTRIKGWSRLIFSGVALLASFFLLLSARAAVTTTITVPNPSFETTSNWTGPQFGIEQPAPASIVYGGGYGGSYVGFVYSPGNGTASYVTSSASLATIAGSMTYNLVVSFMVPVNTSNNNYNNSNAYISGNIALLANGVVIPSTLITKIAPTYLGFMVDYQVSFTTASNDPLIGKSLTIRIGQDAGAPAGTYPSPLFDNVRLTMTTPFIHPGLSHTQADLDRMKNNVNVDPYKTAFLYFETSSFASTTNEQGPSTTESSSTGVGQFTIRNDAQVAHWNAVMWYVTGNTAYRDHAIKVMMDWANTLTSFDITDHITAGTALYDFCNAGEILRATSGGVWTPAQITQFQNWMITYLLPPLDTVGGLTGGMQAAGHGGLQIKGAISLGIFCDRADIYNFGVNYGYLVATGSTYGLQEYIDKSGQNYEWQRDAGHASGNTGAFAQEAQMIYNQGWDLLGTANNLLATGTEAQAKLDLLYDVAPVSWVDQYNVIHNTIAGQSRSPFDNLSSDIAYYLYHTVKGLPMPYTGLSADTKFPDVAGASFMFRVDSSGHTPLLPFTGQPAATDVVLYNGQVFLPMSYLAHFKAGSYNGAALVAAGASTYSALSMHVPAGWTVTVYSNTDFTGSSAVFTTDQGDLGGWDNLIGSMTVTQGTSPYVVSNGTYKIVSNKSALATDVSGASTANGAGIVQEPYTGTKDQLWRVELEGPGQYRLLNLNSNLAMEVPGSSLSNGTFLDQSTYLPVNYALSATTFASHADNGNGHGYANLNDGSLGDYWSSDVNGELETIALYFNTATAVSQYSLTSVLPSSSPTSWVLQGSVDGVNYTTLDTRTNQVFGYGQTEYFNFTNTTPYIYYSINMTAIAGGSGSALEIAEWGLYQSQASTNQKWTINTVPGAAYGSVFNVTNVNSGLVFDIWGNLTNAGASLDQWAYNGGTNQQWFLQVP